MKLTVLVLSLLLCAVSAFSQDTPKTLEEPQPPNVKQMIDKLQKDSQEIPLEFLNLAGKVDLKKWSCTPAAKVNTSTIITNLSVQITEIRLNADTIRAQGYPELVELAEASYAFGRSTNVAILLSIQTAGCTNQKDLSAEFDKMVERLYSAWETAHIIEVLMIESEEDRVHTPKPAPKQEPSTNPFNRSDRT